MRQICPIGFVPDPVPPPNFFPLFFTRFRASSPLAASNAVDAVTFSRKYGNSAAPRYANQPANRELDNRFKKGQFLTVRFDSSNP